MTGPETTEATLVEALRDLADTIERVGTGVPPTSVELIERTTRAIAELQGLVALLVRRARDVDRAAWADIARAAGVTRQTAYARWGKSGRGPEPT